MKRVFFLLFFSVCSLLGFAQESDLAIACDTLNERTIQVEFVRGIACCYTDSIMPNGKLYKLPECPDFIWGECTKERSCYKEELIHGCLYKSDGTYCQGTIFVCYDQDENKSFEFYQDGNLVPASEVLEWESGGCNDDRNFISTTFTPDQYAIVWSINGSGVIQSFDAANAEWTNYGNCGVGSYALAFFNDVSKPTAFFQRSGNLYSFSPDDPCGSQKLIGPTLPAGPSSYPCFDYDPSGRLLAGIGGGSSVIEIDPLTGAATNIGTLIDVRDGAPLSASPGDWFFDPNGNWYMMARDNRATLFGEPCDGTVLWQIDPSTLEVVRVSNSCSPVGGTGATWFAAGRYLLSTSGGDVYEYNEYLDTWTLFEDAPAGINDLASQWIIPDCIDLFGWSKTDCANPDSCDLTLWQLVSNVDGSVTCNPYESTLTGKFAGDCQKEGNPYVSDPSSEDKEFLSDQDWHEGCSAAGVTYWRVSYDPAGNEVYSYLYGTINITDPVTEQPNNFNSLPCGSANRQKETTTWCNLDTGTEIFRKEFNLTGFVQWFDETGQITEPPNKVIGACESSDPLLPVTNETVCIGGVGYIRQVKEVYVENTDGLPELTSTQIIYFNENGTLWDSGIVNAGDPLPTGEPTVDYFGDCTDPYVSVENEKLCEKDAEFLLLIDSGGGFARYSLFTQQWETVSTLSVSSAGGSADYDNFLLYNFVAPDQITVIDVNTDTQLPNVTVTDGIINPAVTTNPKTFSAASFRKANGKLYAWDTAGADAGLYCVNVSTGVVDFVTSLTGISGTGTSIAIDNTTDRLIVNGTNLSYEVDWNTGVGTVWNDPPIQPNGSTFDADGNFYVTQGNNTYVFKNGAWTQIIDDWTPAANSLAYYRTEAQKPSCFHRRYGILADGSRQLIGDFYIGTDTPRAIVGDVDCCEGGCAGSSSSTTIVDFPPTQDFEKSEICIDGKSTAWQVIRVSDTGVETITYEDETGVIPTPPNFTIGGCNCEIFDYWETSSSAAQGTWREREWQNLGIPINDPVTLTGSLDILAGFDNSEGIPVPAQAPDTDVTGANTADVDDTNNTGNIVDYQLKESFIIVEKGFFFRIQGGSERYNAVYIAQCCGEYKKIYEVSVNIGGPATQGDLYGFMPKGIHKIAVLNLDSNGTNASASFQVSEDGVTWSNVEQNYFQAYSSKPSQECKKGYICSDSYYAIDQNTTLDFTLNELSLCEITCETTTTNTASETNTSEVVCDCTGSNEIAYINGTNTITLTGGTFCSYSITVDRGNVNVTENGTASPYAWTRGMTEGDSNQDGCKYLQNTITITGASGNARARISIIR